MNIGHIQGGTRAGWRIVRPARVDRDCPMCGGHVTKHYTRCSSCGGAVN